MPEEVGFLRLPQVLGIIPVSKSTWWSGVRSGRFPRQVKLSVRTTAWKRADIQALCERLSGQSIHEEAGSIEHEYVKPL